MESAAYGVIEDIQYYNKLGGIKKELSNLATKVFVMNQLSARQNNAVMALIKLQSQGSRRIRYYPKQERKPRRLQQCRKLFSISTTPDVYVNLLSIIPACICHVFDKILYNKEYHVRFDNGLGIFATSNNAEKLTEAIRSRFLIKPLADYTFEHLFR
jgi:hypothetical protein